MADNVLAILKYLSSADSPLPSLDAGYTRPSTVFFSHLGFFFMYSYRTARVLYALLFLSAFQFVTVTYRNPALGSGRKELVDSVRQNARGVGAWAIAIGGALVGANVLALVMERALGRGMSWYAVELSALALYGPAALAGALATQLIAAPRLHERTMLAALLVVQSLLAFAIQLVGIGSAVMFALSALPLLGALLLDAAFRRSAGPVSLWTYALGQTMPLLTGTQLICTVLDVFVPLARPFLLLSTSSVVVC